MFMAIEALADGGVKMGIRRELALKLAAQTLLVRYPVFLFVITTGYDCEPLDKFNPKPKKYFVKFAHLILNSLIRGLETLYCFSCLKI